MSMESIEKLREVIGADVSQLGYTNGTKKLHELVDEIEREISERYMELPVDADGEVIRLGDEMDCGEVIGIGEYIAFFGEGIEWQHYSVQAIHHIKPRTIEDVLRELLRDTAHYFPSDCEYDITRAADEIRGLL